MKPLGDLDTVIGKWGLQSTLEALAEWCKEYSELMVGVDSPENLDAYRQCASDVNAARIRFETTMRHVKG
ncbi:MAG: hypothetical protein M0R06_18045 [Sphaerochaeta sp.]|jgi:D-serine deaminase-like pyridoxal phosphate-dependent protein|nr:hypothetical protein [Sphaerochaeta sp.]